jgi:hypothetical protein
VVDSFISFFEVHEHDGNRFLNRVTLNTWEVQIRKRLHAGRAVYSTLESSFYFIRTDPTVKRLFPGADRAWGEAPRPKKWQAEPDETIWLEQYDGYYTGIRPHSAHIGAGDTSSLMNHSSILIR